MVLSHRGVYGWRVMVSAMYIQRQYTSCAIVELIVVKKAMQCRPCDLLKHGLLYTICYYIQGSVCVETASCPLARDDDVS